MSWQDVIRKKQPHILEDIPDEYMKEALEYWEEENMGDRIPHRARHTNKIFWEEFDEVSGGNIDIKFTPEMAQSMRKTWHSLMSDVPIYLMQKWDMTGWYLPENNKLLVEKLSQAFADYMNNMPREGMRRLE